MLCQVFYPYRRARGQGMRYSGRWVRRLSLRPCLGACNYCNLSKHGVFTPPKKVSQKFIKERSWVFGELEKVLLGDIDDLCLGMSRQKSIDALTVPLSAGLHFDSDQSSAVLQHEIDLCLALGPVKKLKIVS